MRCERCGAMNPDNDRFCGECGAKLGKAQTFEPVQSTPLARGNLEPGEKVLWQGKPMLAPFILSGIGGVIPGLFFVVFSLIWVTGASFGGAPSEFIFIGIVFVCIGLLILLGGPLVQWLRYKNTEYIITDRRIITQTGAIGLDTRYIENEWIREVYVNVSIMDRLFGTGSVMVSTASGMIGGTGPHAMRPAMWCLQDPYGVQKVIWGSMRKARPTE